MTHKQYNTKDMSSMVLAEPQVAYGMAMMEGIDTPDEFGVTRRMTHKWVEEAKHEMAQGQCMRHEDVEIWLTEKLGW